MPLVSRHHSIVATSASNAGDSNFRISKLAHHFTSNPADERGLAEGKIVSDAAVGTLTAPLPNAALLATARATTGPANKRSGLLFSRSFAAAAPPANAVA